MEKYYTIVSLGCPKNRVDSEKIMFLMSEAGYQFVEGADGAHVIIINTCAFIEPAVEESINTILDYSGDNPDAIMVVAGCLPLRYKSDASESLPEVDIFIEPEDIHNLPGILDGKSRGSGIKSGELSEGDERAKIQGRLLTTPGYAYLRVSDGCDRKCAYCSIPSIRGRMRSETIESLEKEARDLASYGATELILVAQDLCSYGNDLKAKNGLETLLDRLTKIDPVLWIRLMYLHPNGIPGKLFELMRESEKILPYLDIPIQHISAEVLRSMNRPWNTDVIKALIDRARKEVPGIVLRTTVMVGYPTETENAFQELLDFVETAEIDRVGVFSYSPEEGTEAFALGDPTSYDLKRQRVALIEDVHSRFLEKRNRSKIGQIQKAIVEGYSEETDLLLQGRLWDQAPEIDGNLYITDGSAVTGGIYDVKINEFNGADFFGEIVS